jgi:hypothetical protein
MHQGRSVIRQTPLSTTAHLSAGHIPVITASVTAISQLTHFDMDTSNVAESSVTDVDSFFVDSLVAQQAVQKETNALFAGPPSEANDEESYDERSLGSDSATDFSYYSDLESENNIEESSESDMDDDELVSTNNCSRESQAKTVQTDVVMNTEFQNVNNFVHQVAVDRFDQVVKVGDRLADILRNLKRNTTSILDMLLSETLRYPRSFNEKVDLHSSVCGNIIEASAQVANVSHDLLKLHGILIRLTRFRDVPLQQEKGERMSFSSSA